MGKITRVGIDLPAGLTSNDTTYANKGTYRDASNIRFFQNRAEIVGGFERVSLSPISGACRAILPWKDNFGVSMIALGTHTNLYVYRGGRTIDITPAGYVSGLVDGSIGIGFGSGGFGKGPYGQYTNSLIDYHVRTWSLNNFGQSLIANPRGQPIYWWQNDLTQPATLLSAVTGSVHIPPQVNFTLVNQYRQLLAFGCNQELDSLGAAPGPFEPLCIRGSDIDGNINQWGVSNADNAFEYVLPEGGMIMGARLWGDRIAVWTQTSLYQGTFTGDPTTVYRWDPVDGSLGLLGPNACLIIGQTAYWVSPDLQLWQCALGGSPVQVTCPILYDTLSQIDMSQGEKVVMSYLPVKNEIRIDYPDQRDGVENSRYLLFNLDDGAFSKGLQSRSAMIRGMIVDHPVGAQTATRNLPYPGAITDNASAQTALATIQANLPSYDGANLALRANASSVAGGTSTAVADILTGNSGWGFRITGDGSTTRQGQVGSFGLTVGQKVSISYQAQVVVGPDTAATVDFRSLGGVSVDSTVGLTITSHPQTFKHENITVTATDNVLNFKFITPVAANGAVIEITDIKVAVNQSAKAWTPAPADANLYANYLTFIKNLAYPQIVSDFYYHEIGNSADEQPLAWFLETNDFSLDEDYTAVMVKSFFPDFLNQLGDITLTVFTRMDVQAPEYSFQIVLSPGMNRVDFMETGKIWRFRIEGNSSPASLRMGRPLFDVVAAGTR